MCCILYIERGFVFVDARTDKTAVLNNDVSVNMFHSIHKEVLNDKEFNSINKEDTFKCDDVKNRTLNEFIA